jgi:DNA-binding transcriptional LysR family regulator
LIDLASSGAGLAWLCDFMVDRAQKQGQLIEVLADLAYAELPLNVLSLPSKQVLPKVKLFAEAVRSELRGITW